MLARMEGPSDEELMRAAGTGDEAACAALVRRHQDRVYGTVYRMLGSYHQEAEDVAQQVFIKVFRAAPRWRPEAKFTTWLMTICRNCVFTQLQRSRRRACEPLESEAADGATAGESPHPDPDARPADALVQEEEMRRALEDAMARLPDAQRAALVLRQYEQLNYEDIARTLGTTVPSVKSLLFRAREALRARLEDYLHET
jgi:RNA polymerase sigma-70 factor (ECF subfamily)